MSMSVQFYKIDDDPRVLDKNLGTAILSLPNVKFKDNVDILNPTLEISYYAILLTANYMFIGDFGRYYYITDITTNNLGLIITGKVDVLKTYSSDIYALKAIIARQEDNSKCNAYLRDEKWATLEKQQVITANFPAYAGFCEPHQEECIMVVNGPQGGTVNPNSNNSGNNSGNNSQGGGE